MNNYNVLTKKIQLCPVGDKDEVDRVYKYLRDGMYAQNKAYNILISAVYAAIIDGNKEKVNELYKLGARNPKKDCPEYSLYDYDAINFAKGLNTAATVQMRVKSDVKTAQENGLFKGNTSLPSRKRTSPLWIEKRQFSFMHNCSSDEELAGKIFSSSLEVKMNFVNGISFYVVLGNGPKSESIRNTFLNLFSGDWEYAQSSIQIDEEGEGKEKTYKIILNLALKIPKKEYHRDENVVVGVDLGINIPAVCALNNDFRPREKIGSKDNFLKVKTQIKEQRRRLSIALRNTRGGHGRKKKLRPLDRFDKYESNFVKSYNHMVSRRVVDFAIKNNAKYINVEDLSGISKKKDNPKILKDWSYYQLQQFIKYKAEIYGIEMRKVDPYMTSQTCSCCGNLEPGQRIDQATFICKNPACKMHGKTMNADYNAARNIAMSTNFVTDDENEDENGKKTAKKRSKSKS